MVVTDTPEKQEIENKINKRRIVDQEDESSKNQNKQRITRRKIVEDENGSL